MAATVPDYRSRQETLREAMRKEGLSAVVVFSMNAYATLCGTSGYLRYLTGWTSRFGPSVLVQPVDGPSTLLVGSYFDVAYARDAFPWIGRCASENKGDYGKTARRLLLEAGAQRVGVVGLSEIPYQIYQDLATGEGEIAFTPADHLVEDPRNVKDESDIEHMREAARISDQMLGTLAEVLRGHRGPAWKLLVEMEHAGRSAGAETATAWLGVGQPADRQLFLLETLQHEIRPGDQILTGTYVTYRGYWAHCLRMMSVGEPTEGYRKLYEAAVKAQQAGVAQIRVGGDARRITEEIDRVSEDLVPGSSDPSQPYRFRYAHFVGYEYAEKLSGKAFPQPGNWFQGGRPTAGEVLLQPGMTLEVHPNIGVPGVGFAVMGDVFLVRQEGPERLNKFPQDLVVA